MEGLFLFGQMCVDGLVVGRFPGAGGEGEGRDAWPGRKVSVWVRQEEGKKEGEPSPEFPAHSKRECRGCKPAAGINSTYERAESLPFLHGLESNPGSSLQTEEEAGLP